MGRSSATQFEVFILKLMNEHAACYMQDAVHILGAVRDFAKTSMTDSANEEYRGHVVGLCHGLVVKIHRDHKDELARSIPESVRILANRTSGSPLHQWNVACEISHAAVELLEKLPKPPPPPPKPSKKDSEAPKSSRRSGRPLPS